MKKIVRNALQVVLVSLLVVDSAFATDGYFLTGYGTKQQGQGGAGIAHPADSLAGATNPAGLYLAGNRTDIGLTLFRPNRSATLSDSGLPTQYGVDGTYNANRVKNFELPELGYSRIFNPKLSLGVALYGNGGLNTSYTKPIPLLGSTRGGVDLEQLFISPTLSYKLGKHNAIGVAANIAYQRFSAEGLQNFASANSSLYPADVTNTGHANSYGAGVRVGWLGELNRYLSVGATYQTKTHASAFSRYKGLFAEGGKFDIPANFGGGASVKIAPQARLFVDEERILYSGVKAVHNSDANQTLLGTSNGPGFGWHSINVFKAGLDYDLSHALTVRGGYNHGGLPFDGTQAFFNVLAPAVVQNHLHLGTTFSLANGKEINLAYIHAFSKTLNAANSIPTTAGGGNISLNMDQNSFQVSFAWNRNKK